MLRLRTTVPMAGFNPRPCGRGDAAVALCERILPVSIHAPVGGATCLTQTLRRDSKFQSTPLWEGRPVVMVTAWRVSGVSIHAPVGGATSRRLTSPGNFTGFNPRPCGRGDFSPTNKTPSRPSFNPRPCGRGDPHVHHVAHLGNRFNPRPCGRGDLAEALQTITHRCFNPRPCGRGDNRLKSATVAKVVSIHAPVGGATTAASKSDSVSKFQSTPLWEGRPMFIMSRISVIVSIHAPVGGATRDGGLRVPR